MDDLSDKGNRFHHSVIRQRPSPELRCGSGRRAPRGEAKIAVTTHPAPASSIQCPPAPCSSGPARNPGSYPPNSAPSSPHYHLHSQAFFPLFLVLCLRLPTHASPIFFALKVPDSASSAAPRVAVARALWVPVPREVWTAGTLGFPPSWRVQPRPTCLSRTQRRDGGLEPGPLSQLCIRSERRRRCALAPLPLPLRLLFGLPASATARRTRSFWLPRLPGSAHNAPGRRSPLSPNWLSTEYPGDLYEIFSLVS
ncbi:uncharacterized protein LOC132532852 [Erinaceus europaeus]|uniref:Uncharacterized protein LOC132532852 n=1 Tax=Erinaceus europaeus TaxID=9365 RepID=A0ABM3VV58_ERIEU|nr:uncharacterized protein LOC132532852 [Erinaceus europaeus]